MTPLAEARDRGFDSAEHAAFLRRNGEALAAVLDAAFPDQGPVTGPLVDELTILVGSRRLSTQLGRRNLARWRSWLRGHPPERRRLFTLADWRRASRSLERTDPEAGRRLFLLYQRLGARADYPGLAAMRRWGYRRWQSLLVGAGCDPSLAASVTSILLCRRELPGGPCISQIYWRLGYPCDTGGLPTRVAVRSSDRARLRRGFVALATEQCLPDLEPGPRACLHCPVRRFCSAYRSSLSKNGTQRSSPFVDLFAGPGGLSLGLASAGMRPVLVVEKERRAADTLYLNHPEIGDGVLLCDDVRRLVRDGSTLARYAGIPVVAGGPPCQPFSLARRHSRADRRDPRRNLVYDFVRAARRLDPLVVVMENVPGIQNARDGNASRSVVRAFSRAGFLTVSKTLNAAEYGVPQARVRVFFIGVNRRRVKAPEPVLEHIVHELDAQRQTAPGPTVRIALCRLPERPPGSGQMVDRSRFRGRPSRYLRSLGPGQPLVFNHTSRPHNARDLRIFRELRWGETAEGLEIRRPGMIPYRLDSFADKYRKLHPDRPSPTIPSHLKRDANSFVHPFECRGITPREAARLQSFPDDYFFLGGFGPSFVQVGNAVPPILARALGRAVLASLPQAA